MINVEKCFNIEKTEVNYILNQKSDQKKFIKDFESKIFGLHTFKSLQQ